MAPRLLLRFASFYNHNFDRRPIPTLVVTNGVLGSIADAIVSVAWTKTVGERAGRAQDRDVCSRAGRQVEAWRVT